MKEDINKKIVRENYTSKIIPYISNVNSREQIQPQLLITSIKIKP